MAKFSRTSENRAVWNGLAERWVRCAKLMDRKDSEYYTPLPEAPSKGHLQFGALTKSGQARSGTFRIYPLAVGLIQQLREFFQKFQLRKLFQKFRETVGNRLCNIVLRL
jgi:hypothetical protein